jgi:hypothetical protein
MLLNRRSMLTVKWQIVEAKIAMTPMINAVMTAGKSKTTEQPKASKMVRRKSCEAIMVMVMMMLMATIILCVDGEFHYACLSFRIVSAVKAQKVAE